MPPCYEYWGTGRWNLIVRPQPEDDNPLWNYFSHNQGRLIHKWHHYFDIYHNHFSRFRGRSVTVLEIGVFKGGSLQMWKNYFGPNAEIYGVDIDPRCKAMEEDQIQVYIGDQADRSFLRKLGDEIGPIDILIDDGGHTMTQQITTFEELYPYVSATGVYLIEDLHTSYMEEYGGGYKKPGTFIEYAKDFIDRMNAWHSREAALAPSDLTMSATGLHFYDSVLVIEKYPSPTKPLVSMTGDGTNAPVLNEHSTGNTVPKNSTQCRMARIHELEEQLAEMERTAEARAVELEVIKRSNAWYITQLIWKVKTLLAPHGSKREQIGQSILRGLRFRNGPVSVKRPK